MALAATNALVAVTGGVFVAPLATAVPTDTTTALNVAFKELGYLDDTGVVESMNDSTNAIKAWQNSDIVRRVQTEHSYQLKFTAIETNAVSLAQWYGAYTSTTGAGTATVKGGLLAQQAWVFSIVDGTQKKRIVVPVGQVVARGDLQNVATGVVAYPFTLECYPDSTGTKAYVYLATAGTP